MGDRAEPTVRLPRPGQPLSGVTRLGRQLRELTVSITSRRARRLLVAGALATALLAAKTATDRAVVFAAADIATPAAVELSDPMPTYGLVFVAPSTAGDDAGGAAVPGLRVGPRALPQGATLDRQSGPARAYAVRRGDTLGAIARREGVSLRDLLDANNLLSSQVILPGQILLVPGKGAADNDRQATEAPKPGATSRPAQAPQAAEPTRPAAAPVPSKPTTVQAPSLKEATAQPAADSAKTPDAGDSERSDRPTPTARGDRNIASWQEDFLNAAIEAAQASQDATGVPASVTVAQAILESDWGRSTIMGANNYFGIKAETKPGPAGVVWAPTKEYTAKGWVTISAPFRAYENMAQSFTDHANFFLENSRYAEAMRNTADARRFAQLIQAAGYATDPGYAQSLIRIMDRYDLYRYDRRPDQAESAAPPAAGAAQDALPSDLAKPGLDRPAPDSKLPASALHALPPARHEAGEAVTTRDP